MKLITITEENEIKLSKHKKYTKGRPPEITRKLYFELQLKISKKYVNHGNILAHPLGLIHNQTNQKGDKENFTENGMSSNLFWSRGLTFCDSCYWFNYQQHNTPTVKNKRLTGKSDLRTIPIMYVYDKHKIHDLMKRGICKLFIKYLPSKEHEDVEDGVFEYRADDREDMPHPKYIIIGKNYNHKRQSKKYRIDFKNEFLIPVSKRYPNTTIIHMPDIKMGLLRKNGTPGNNQASVSGIHHLDAINACDAGLYDSQMEYINETPHVWRYFNYPKAILVNLILAL